MKRYLIAIDSEGTCRLRETLCVTHYNNSGEVRYDCKVPRRVPKAVQAALLAASRALESDYRDGLLKRERC